MSYAERFIGSQASPKRVFSADRLSPKVKSPLNQTPNRLSKLNSPKIKSPSILASPKAKVTVRNDIPDSPFMSIDVPDIPSDFYQFPLDISPKNIIAVVSNRVPYIYSLSTKKQVPSFYKLRNCMNVKFCNDNNDLIISSDVGLLSIGDVSTVQLQMTIKLGMFYINSIDQLGNSIVTSNSNGTICNLDRRAFESMHFVQSYQSPIITAKYSPDGTKIVTTSERPGFKVWDTRNFEKPYYEFLGTKSLMRAVDWNYKHQSQIAVGGGLSDKMVRIIDINNGNTISSANVGSQVCNVFWNCDYNEILVTHGFSSCSVSLWKSSNMKNITTLNVFHDRVLYGAISHDKSNVVIATPKDPLMVWKFFPKSEPRLDIESKTVR